MKYQHKLEKERMCPIEHGLEAFGGKWKARIICVLSTDDTMRYKQLKKELSNITDTVLAAMLKDLIADGLIARTQYNEIPQGSSTPSPTRAGLFCPFSRASAPGPRPTPPETWRLSCPPAKAAASCREAGLKKQSPKLRSAFLAVGKDYHEEVKR